MKFRFTDYLYPISAPITLSAKSGFFLDNPRTDDEIAFVAGVIKDYHRGSAALRFPPRANSKYISLSSMLRDIQAFFTDDPYLASVYKDHFSAVSYDRIFEFLARIWIISRYDDEGSSQEMYKIHQEMIKKGEHGFFLIDDDDPFEKNANNLVDYSQVIALLIHTQGDEYAGGSFVNDTVHLAEYPNTRFEQCLFLLTCYVYSTRKDKLEWKVLPAIKDSLVEQANDLDRFVEKNGDKTLIHIGNMLKLSQEKTSSDEIRLVLLTGIIEFLLTRNPDTNRFNVEDSINKQFQLKTCMLLHQNDNKIRLEETRTKLREIYTLRSCIAHGDFSRLRAIIEKQRKKGQKYYLNDLVCNLYGYIRSLLQEYLKDPEFVEFVKRS